MDKLRERILSVINDDNMEFETYSSGRASEHKADAIIDLIKPKKLDWGDRMFAYGCKHIYTISHPIDISKPWGVIWRGGRIDAEFRNIDAAKSAAQAHDNSMFYDMMEVAE